MALTIELDDVSEFDSTFTDSIVNNTRRYSNMFAEIVYELLPTYREKEVSWVQVLELILKLIF